MVRSSAVSIEWSMRLERFTRPGLLLTLFCKQSTSYRGQPFVLKITSSRDRFGQRTHPPCNIAESAPQLLTSKAPKKTIS